MIAIPELAEESARDRFGPKRKKGAHPLRGLEQSGDKTESLHNLRQLQKEVFQ